MPRPSRARLRVRSCRSPWTYRRLSATSRDGPRRHGAGHAGRPRPAVAVVDRAVRVAGSALFPDAAASRGCSSAPVEGTRASARRARDAVVCRDSRPGSRARGMTPPTSACGRSGSRLADVTLTRRWAPVERGVRRSDVPARIEAGRRLFARHGRSPSLLAAGGTGHRRRHRLHDLGPRRAARRPSHAFSYSYRSALVPDGLRGRPAGAGRPPLQPRQRPPALHQGHDPDKVSGCLAGVATEVAA